MNFIVLPGIWLIIFMFAGGKYHLYQITWQMWAASHFLRSGYWRYLLLTRRSQAHMGGSRASHPEQRSLCRNEYFAGRPNVVINWGRRVSRNQKKASGAGCLKEAVLYIVVNSRCCYFSYRLKLRKHEWLLLNFFAIASSVKTRWPQSPAWWFVKCLSAKMAHSHMNLVRKKWMFSWTIHTFSKLWTEDNLRH